MSTKQNLAIVPALKVDDGAPGAPWVGGGDWARTTSAHASLPRTTAYAGTTAPAGSGLICSLATGATAGKYYVASVSVRATAPQTGALNIDWKTGANVYLSTSNGAGSDYGDINMTAGSTQRFAVLGLAPTDTGKVVPVLAGLDAGGAQATACMIRQFDTLMAAEAAIEEDRLAAGYFDGDSPGAAWDGADGESTSTLTFNEAPHLTAALSGPTAVITPTVTITAPVLAAELAGPQAAIGLLTQVVYDDRRGRIRISAQGLAPTVVRAVVSSRPVGGSRWTQVRGGKVAVQNAAFARTVDDYEFAAGAGMQYRIQGLSSQEGEPDAVVQTRVVTLDYVLAHSWVKFISAPYLNTRVRILRDFAGARRRSRAALYEVQGRRDPVAVTDVHTGRTMTVRVVTLDLAARDALDDALGSGRPIFLHTPVGIPVPTMYAVVGDHGWVPSGPRSVRSIFEISLVEVAAPPPSVVGVGLTYGVLATQFASYDDLTAAYSTYGEIG